MPLDAGDGTIEHMRAILPPPVPYDQTSLRPSWPSLPAAFRVALADRLGAEIVSASVKRTGFTPGFAAVLTLADGSARFVKAADLAARIAKDYVREALISQNLPHFVPAAPVNWSGELAGHFVLCLPAIDGAHTPALPWEPAELEAALTAVTQVTTALADPPPALLAAGLTPWAKILDTVLHQWRSGHLDHPHLAELVALESRFDSLTRGSSALIHCDLRLDNVVIDAAGNAWICDWNHLCYGPPWFDTLSLLLSAEASGLDTDTLFAAHPTAVGLPPDALDAALAAFAGYYVHSGALPGFADSPNIRGHQRYCATLTLRWLARRRGWS